MRPEPELTGFNYAVVGRNFAVSAERLNWSLDKLALGKTLADD